MANKIKYKWSVIYLIHAIDITWLDAKNMIDAIVRVKQNKEVSIVFCLCTRHENLAEIVPGFILPHTGNSGPVTTVFLKMKAGGNKNEKNELQIIQEINDFDIRDPAQLAVYFKRQVLKDHRAEHYLLFTWDHGMAYGMFKGEKLIAGGANSKSGSMDGPVTKEDLVKKEQFRETVVRLKQKKIIEPGTGFPMLTAAELADAIKWAFGKKKIDVIIMMNCYMQLLDTCFAMSAVANYMVAAETLFYDMTPFNYDMLFNAMNVNPEILPARLCKVAIGSVKKMYENKNIGSVQLGVAVFAISLKYLPAIVKQVDLLSMALSVALKTDFELIRECRRKCGHIPAVPASLVDLQNFIGLVSLHMPCGWQINTQTRLSAILSKAIFAKYLHRVYKVETDHDRRINPSGFSVCFPVHLPDPDAAEDFYTTYFSISSACATLFSRLHSWQKFVDEYLRMEMVFGPV